VAIHSTFIDIIDVIVNISAIRTTVHGGWKSCRKDHAHLIGGLTLPCAWLIPHGPCSVNPIGVPGSAVLGLEPAMFNQ
jgi:hypothetical protein